MSAAVTRCVVEDLDVVITVETRVSLGRIGGGAARAVARAGPADGS
jgi:hypothetical protein